MINLFWKICVESLYGCVTHFKCYRLLLICFVYFCVNENGGKAQIVPFT